MASTCVRDSINSVPDATTAALEESQPTISEGLRFRYKFLGGYLLLDASLFLVRAMSSGGTIWLVLLFPLTHLALAIFLLLERRQALTVLKYFSLIIFLSFVISLRSFPEYRSASHSYLNLAESLGFLLLSIRAVPRLASIACYVVLTAIIGYRLYLFL
jgi:hypothetical protein